MKTATSVWIDANLKIQAKQKGVNLSQTLEQALKAMIDVEEIETSKEKAFFENQIEQLRKEKKIIEEKIEAEKVEFKKRESELLKEKTSIDEKLIKISAQLQDYEDRQEKHHKEQLKQAEILHKEIVGSGLLGEIQL